VVLNPWWVGWMNWINGHRVYWRCCSWIGWDDIHGQWLSCCICDFRGVIWVLHLWWVWHESSFGIGKCLLA
jgi:hypothetical protein